MRPRDGAKKPVKEVLPSLSAPPGSEAWHQALKEKHKAFAGTRLAKSIKPVETLGADRGIRHYEKKS